jgi:hypothetical protein
VRGGPHLLHLLRLLGQPGLRLRVHSVCAVTGWTVEGVIRCPGDCGLYFDFCGTPQDLQTFISEHDCAFAQTGEKFR